MGEFLGLVSGSFTEKLADASRHPPLWAGHQQLWSREFSASQDMLSHGSHSCSPAWHTGPRGPVGRHKAHVPAAGSCLPGWVLGAGCRCWARGPGLSGSGFASAPEPLFLRGAAGDSTRRGPACHARGEGKPSGGPGPGRGRDPTRDMAQETVPCQAVQTKHEKCVTLVGSLCVPWTRKLPNNGSF